jgi:hypothetical protein
MNALFTYAVAACIIAMVAAVLVLAALFLRTSRVDRGSPEDEERDRIATRRAHTVAAACFSIAAILAVGVLIGHATGYRPGPTEVAWPSLRDRLAGLERAVPHLRGYVTSAQERLRASWPAALPELRVPWKTAPTDVSRTTVARAPVAPAPSSVAAPQAPTPPSPVPDAIVAHDPDAGQDLSVLASTLPSAVIGGPDSVVPLVPPASSIPSGLDARATRRPRGDRPGDVTASAPRVDVPLAPLRSETARNAPAAPAGQGAGAPPQAIRREAAARPTAPPPVSSPVAAPTPTDAPAAPAPPVVVVPADRPAPTPDVEDGDRKGPRPPRSEEREERGDDDRHHGRERTREGDDGKRRRGDEAPERQEVARVGDGSRSGDGEGRRPDSHDERRRPDVAERSGDVARSGWRIEEPDERRDDSGKGGRREPERQRLAEDVAAFEQRMAESARGVDGRRGAPSAVVQAERTDEVARLESRPARPDRRGSSPREQSAARSSSASDGTERRGFRALAERFLGLDNPRRWGGWSRNENDLIPVQRPDRVERSEGDGSSNDEGRERAERAGSPGDDGRKASERGGASGDEGRRTSETASRRPDRDSVRGESAGRGGSGPDRISPERRGESVDRRIEGRGRPSVADRIQRPSAAERIQERPSAPDRIERSQGDGRGGRGRRGDRGRR